MENNEKKINRKLRHLGAVAVGKDDPEYEETQKRIRDPRNTDYAAGPVAKDVGIALYSVFSKHEKSGFKLDLDTCSLSMAVGIMNFVRYVVHNLPPYEQERAKIQTMLVIASSMTAYIDNDELGDRVLKEVEQSFSDALEVLTQETTTKL